MYNYDIKRFIMNGLISTLVFNNLNIKGSLPIGR